MVYTIKITTREGKPKRDELGGIKFNRKTGTAIQTTVIVLDDNDLDIFFKILKVFDNR